MYKRVFKSLGKTLLGCSIAVLLIAGAMSPASAAWPERPVTLIVPWSAGGGTDATGRMIGSLLEKELGKPFNVVNRDGGSGVIGHSAIANSKPDGYTIGVITVEIGMMHWAGLTKLSGTDYTPIALYNADPAGLLVRTDSPWESAQDLLDAVKSDNGAHKASGTGQGGIWHLALAGMLNSADMSPEAAPWVPSQGAAPGLQELVSEGVDMVTCSIVEAAALIDAGKVKSLAIMSDTRSESYPDVPTLQEATGVEWQMAAWRGIAGPKDLPEEVVTTLTTALEKVYQSAEFQDFMSGRGFGLVWKSGDDFANWMAESDTSLGEVMTAVGMAK